MAATNVNVLHVQISTLPRKTPREDFSEAHRSVVVDSQDGEARVEQQRDVSTLPPEKTRDERVCGARRALSRCATLSHSHRHGGSVGAAVRVDDEGKGVAGRRLHQDSLVVRDTI